MAKQSEEEGEQQEEKEEEAAAMNKDRPYCTTVPTDISTHSIISNNTKYIVILSLE